MDYGIKERREELNMTQEELSAKSGVSRQTISALECGKAENVLVGTLAAIAKALNTTVDDFFCKQCPND
jgi:putative transcriptional regulator